MKHANSDQIRDVLLEFIKDCKENWIGSLAIEKVEVVDNEIWDKVREPSASTFLSLLAKMNKTINESESRKLLQSAKF